MGPHCREPHLELGRKARSGERLCQKLDPAIQLRLRQEVVRDREIQPGAACREVHGVAVAAAVALPGQRQPVVGVSEPKEEHLLVQVDHTQASPLLARGLNPAEIDHTRVGRPLQSALARQEQARPGGRHDPDGRRLAQGAEEVALQPQE